MPVGYLDASAQRIVRLYKPKPSGKFRASQHVGGRTITVMRFRRERMWRDGGRILGHIKGFGGSIR